MQSISIKSNSINRRNFLKAGAGFAVAPVFVSSHAFGANDRVTVGMIGVGRQAYYVNMKQLLGMQDVQITAVCDVDSWRLDNAKKVVEKTYGKKTSYASYKGCDAYADWRELLARKDIDAIMNSTPDHWHVPIAIAAMKSGKDVSCEKPLTLSIAEGRMMADVASDAKRVFRTDSEFRSLRPFHRAVELVRNGRIGKIHTMRTGVPKSDVGCEPQPSMPIPEELNYEMWVGPAPMHPYTLNRVHPRQDYGRPGWMRVRDTCEGMVTNWGAHLNDIAQWGNDTERTGPVSVEGTGAYPKTKGLWNILNRFDIKYEYANGVKLYYKTDYPYVRFEGENGWIQINFSPQKITASSDAILKSEIKENEIHFPFKSDKRDFIDAVKTRGQSLEDAEVGHRTTSLCQIGHIAIQVGGKLQWDPDKETFPSSPDANNLLHRKMRNPWSWNAINNIF
jgi:myo-inositol 2-dehydrogenase / D-chiro-inositol 1-dehydrogenase